MSDTVQSLWQAAYAYSIAIEKLCKDLPDDNGVDSLPILMLAGFTFELAGKAFIRSRGDSRRFGHNLKALYAAVDENGLGIAPQLSQIIDLLAKPHLEHSFRYLPDDLNVWIPDLSTLGRLAREFVEELAVIMAGSSSEVPEWISRSDS